MDDANMTFDSAPMAATTAPATIQPDDHPMSHLAAVAPHAVPNTAQHSFLQHLAGALGGFSQGLQHAQPTQISPEPAVQIQPQRFTAYQPNFVNLAKVSR